MKKIVTILLMLLGAAVFADESGKFNVFKESKYNGSNFKISKVQFHHGAVVISIIQVKNKSEDKGNVETNGKNDWYCRAWLNIEKDGDLIHQEFFSDIEPVGGAYGLFVPHHQPSPDYFLVEKIGGYDGELYLIRKDGFIQKIHGGRYFVTANSRYLFSEHDADEDGLIDVFDFAKGKLIFANTEPLPYSDAYRKGDTYFYTKDGLSPDGNDEVEDKGNVFVFDYLSSKFIPKKTGKVYWKDVKKVTYDFDPNEFYPCNCEIKLKQ